MSTYSTQSTMSQTFTYQETVTPKICDVLAKISFPQFKQFYSNTEIDQTGDEMSLVTQYNMLHAYANEMISKKYTRLSTYHYTGNNTDGRLFLKDNMGLQRIWHKFRGVLSDGLTRDVDMINAHPTILAYICKKFSIQANELNKYVINRDLCCNDLMKDDKIIKGEAKMLFLKAINFNQHIMFNDKKKIKNKFFITFDVEMKNIQTQLCVKYPELYKELQKTKPNNPEGSLVNKLMCKIENELLQKAMNHIKAFYKISVPFFDGFTFFIDEKVKLTDQDIIDRFNRETSEFNMKWSFKEHNTEIATILETLDTNTNSLFFVGETEYDVAIYCVNTIFENKLFKSDSDVYIYDSKIWTKNDSHNIICKILGQHDLYISNGKGDILISKSSNKQDSLAKMIMRNVKVDNKFPEKMYQSTLYKLCFQNGFYDFKAGQFFEYTNDNIPLTPFIIDRDYTTDVSRVEDIYIKLLQPIFNTTDRDDSEIKYMLHKLARKIAGHAIEDKEWMVMLGSRNSGKSLLSALFTDTFEKYIAQTNSGNFITKVTMGEESKLLAWMDGLEFKRIIFTNEITMNTDKFGNITTTLDGNLIKKLSGGDQIICRTNCKDERKFNHQSSLIMCCNDLPIITPDDTKKNLYTFNMPCSFMTDEAWDSTPSLEQQTLIRQVADVTIKTGFCKESSVIDSFMNLLFQAYSWDVKKPAKINIAAIEDNETSDLNRFLEFFTFHMATCNECQNNTCESHIVFNTEIEHVISANRIIMTKQKTSKTLVGLKSIPVKTKTGGRGFRGLSLNM